MENLTIRKTGNVPAIFESMFRKIEQPNLTKKDLKIILNEEVNFYVVDCKIGHGNTSVNGAWFCSTTNGGNDWTINISF